MPLYDVGLLGFCLVGLTKCSTVVALAAAQVPFSLTTTRYCASGGAPHSLTAQPDNTEVTHSTDYWYRFGEQFKTANDWDLLRRVVPIVVWQTGTPARQ